MNQVQCSGAVELEHILLFALDIKCGHTITSPFFLSGLIILTFRFRFHSSWLTHTLQRNHSMVLIFVMFLFHFDVLKAVNITKILVGINMFILLAIGSRIFFFFGLFFPIHLALKSNNYVQRQIEVSLLLKDKA